MKFDVDQYKKSATIFEGDMYRVYTMHSPQDVNRQEFILEEKATGNLIKRFKQRGLALGMAKGLDAGLMGWNGWTPAFIAKTN